MTGGVIHISDASLQITEVKVNKSINSSIDIAPTLPLFVTELQDPLNILLGHKVIIFQCLKENRRHFSGMIVLHNTGHQGSMHTYLTNVQERAELNMIS